MDLAAVVLYLFNSTFCSRPCIVPACARQQYGAAVAATGTTPHTATLVNPIPSMRQAMSQAL